MTANASKPSRPGVIFWFRQDLRLHDQPALQHALAQAQGLGGWFLPVYVHDQRLQALTAWGFKRTGPLRNAWWRMAVHELSNNLTAAGSQLIEAEGDPVTLLSQWADALGHPLVICEEIAAPEEQAQIDVLRRMGLPIETVWQSTLMSPADLPFSPEEVPDRFTTFRQHLENRGAVPTRPMPVIQTLPPRPPERVTQICREMSPAVQAAKDLAPADLDRRAAFPFNQAAFGAGEKNALAHLKAYCRKGLPHTYKATRNGLFGLDYSSKWSPWLATGALSARTAWAALSAFESVQGASESSYWLFFELLWRDHFRWLHRKHGKRLYLACGLTDLPTPPHDPRAFLQWCRGETGHPFIDAGMKELAATGYLSNRMRQNVASYLIHDLACDWRAGAAWFEACLIDYDAYSNQGNWLYLSGRGTDPRSSRRFNPDLQARNYDPDGKYQALWASDCSETHAHSDPCLPS